MPSHNLKVPDFSFPLLKKKKAFSAVTFSGKASIKPVDDRTTTVLINNGCPKGIKDNIEPTKAVRFFISKLTFNKYTNCRET